MTRWRAEKGKTYYYVDSTGFTVLVVDRRMPNDDRRYATGNYFSTESDALIYYNNQLELRRCLDEIFLSPDRKMTLANNIEKIVGYVCDFRIYNRAEV